MVPQGQLAYHTPTPAAPPLYQTSPFQFSQPPHLPYMQSASAASASETPIYGHPTHPAAYVGTPASVPPSCTYPSSTHYTNFTHNAGSEHTSASFSNGGTLPCAWQGQALPPSSSPPPPTYPPGFEPKQNNVSTSYAPSNVTLGNPCVTNLRPIPHLNALTHQHQHAVPVSQPPHLHPHPHSHNHPSSQTACHTHPTVQSAHPSMFHGYDGSGTVIGVPVMGTPVYMDAICVAPPPAIPQSQEPAQIFQARYGRRLGSSETRQKSCRSTFHLTKYFRSNGSHSGSSPKGTRKFHQNTWQPSNSQTNDSLFCRDYSSPKMGRPFAPCETNYEHRLPPRVEETQQLCTDTSSFQDLDHKQLDSTFDNVSLDPVSTGSGMESDPACELSPRASGRQPSNTCRDDQPQSIQDQNFKAGPAKENRMPNTLKIHVDVQQNLDLCRFSDYRENLLPEDIGGRSDGQLLRFNSCERASLASACSEAQCSSHITCPQKECSPEISGEELKIGSASSKLMDSKPCASPSMKSRGCLTRWLEQRKNNYPTPANILRKAEERKKLEEMGDFDYDKPIGRRQHGRNGFTMRYGRQERPRIDKNVELLGQRICEKIQLANSNNRDKEDECEQNDSSDRYYSVNVSDTPHKIEDLGSINSLPIQGQLSDFEKSIQGADSPSILSPPPQGQLTDLKKVIQGAPILSPPFQGQLLDLEKGVQGSDSQCIPTNDEMAKPNDIERTPSPGNMFLFRGKRRKQQHEQITSVVQRQKKLLFKLLDRDIEKESSYLLQCCRFIVNNQFLQGLSPSYVKHFKWAGGAKPCSLDGLSPDGTQSSPFTSEREMSDLGVEDLMIEKIAQDLPNEDGKECSFKGEDNSQKTGQSNLANVENPCDVDLLIEDTEQELSCSNKEQEQIADSQHASALPLQELSSSNEEPDLIAEEAYRETGSQPCHQDDVGEVHLDFNHNRSLVDRSINGSEASCSRYEKEAIFPWKHVDCYLDQRTTANGFTARHYDCIRDPFFVGGLITDGRHAPILQSSSSLDAQGPPPFLWEQSNTDLHLPNHDTDTGELGIYDRILDDDDDDISQYMNFDAFETDSGMCYG